MFSTLLPDKFHNQHHTQVPFVKSPVHPLYCFFRLVELSSAQFDYMHFAEMKESKELRFEPGSLLT
jgi:hypothetical protein